jgi:transcriptional regulator with XRE-family HTH domain
LSLGALLAAIREGEGWSQAHMGELLGVSRAHVCDIEKGRRLVAPDRAARWAKVLGYGEKQFVRLALQDQLRAAGVKMKVEVHAA